MSGLTPFYSGNGDINFRNIGPDDRPPALPRYGFRAFGIHNTTERKTIRRPGRPPLRGPLTLADDPCNGTLTGPYRVKYHYGPGVNVASCLAPSYFPSAPRETHRAPHITNSGTPHGCGFYAFGSTDPAGLQYPVNTYAATLPLFVHSVVELTGFRVVGTKGCLAERLQIIAIALPVECTLRRGQDDPLAEDIFDRFGPALERLVRARYPHVMTYGSVDQMVAEHPLTPLPKAA